MAHDNRLNGYAVSVDGGFRGSIRHYDNDAVKYTVNIVDGILVITDGDALIAAGKMPEALPAPNKVAFVKTNWADGTSHQLAVFGHADKDTGAYMLQLRRPTPAKAEIKVEGSALQALLSK